MLRRTVNVCALLLMLAMQGSSAADADPGQHESMKLAVTPVEPALPSNLSDTLGTADKPVMDGTDTALRAWPEGKVYSEAKTAVWSETEAELRRDSDGKVIGTLTGARTWTEVDAEWRPMDPGERGAWLGRPTHGQGMREKAAFSSVISVLAGGTAELQAPAVPKPLGLLSKAAWTKSSSSSSSKSSSTTTKAPSNTSPPATSTATTTQAQHTASPEGSSNSSLSNSSFTLGTIKHVLNPLQFFCN